MPSHPNCTLTYESVTENPPHRLLGVERGEYLDSLDSFRMSPQAQAMIPETHLLNWFKKKGACFRHIALTARPRKTVSVAVEWVLCHFGEWIQTVSFVPAERPGEPLGHPDRDKGGFLSWLGKAVYFVDDNPGNVTAAKELGIEAFLVSCPWNSGGSALRDIVETGLKK